jgi:hypothetical protein
VAWQKLGDVHADLPRFRERFGKPLLTLTLVGHELRGLPPEFGDGGLRSLTSLSLASNGLTHLPESICNLGHLRQLNLLRNKLTVWARHAPTPSRVALFRLGLGAAPLARVFSARYLFMYLMLLFWGAWVLATMRLPLALRCVF